MVNGKQTTAGSSQNLEVRDRMSGLKLISDLRLLTSVMDAFYAFYAFYDFYDFYNFYDFPNSLIN